MRIHSLTIDNVRGIDHLELHELPETGVIVIHGDNEQGKSTIMDALNAVLNFKHNSRGAKTVGRLVPTHRDVSPSVALTATMGPVTFTVEKTWFRGRSARLTVTSPQRDTFTGEQAEATLDQIKNDHLDADLLRTLFLRQDDLGGSVDAVGISSLTRALDAASGTEGVPGSEDSGLMQAVDAEYARYFTPAGKEKENGELKPARLAAEAAAAEHAQAAAEVESLDGHVRAHGRAVEERERAETELPGAVAEEQELAAKAEAAAEAAAQAELLRREFERVEEDLAHATRAVEQRRFLVDAVSLAAEDLQRRREGLEDATRAAEQEQRKLTDLEGQLKAARERHRVAGDRLREARATLRLVQAAERRDQLKKQAEDVHELNFRLSHLFDYPVGMRATEDDVRAVEEATAELALQQALREQAAAKLHFHGGADTVVAVDGQPLAVGEDGVTVELVDGLEIRIGEVAARYAAGASVSSPGVDPVAAAETALKDLLAGLGFVDLASVRTAWNVTRETGEAIESLTRERSRLLDGTDPEELAAELAGLNAELADAELPEGLDPAAAQVLVEEAEDARDAVAEEIATLDATLNPWRERRAGFALREISARIEAAEQALALAEERLALAEQKESSAELEADVEKARTAQRAAAERFSVAEAAVREAQPELASRLHQGAATRVEGLRDSLSRAERKLTELTVHIEIATGAAERLEKAEALAEAAQRRLESVDRRARAVQLLRETLHRHRDVVRARYAQPFADQLSGLARTVFGHDVEFTLSDGLEVTKRSIGDNTVSVEDLSGGAKEQLAILTRFAIAGLVSRDSGDGKVPVPVVIDDALGSTDPSRLQLISTLFTEMGKNCQVIVLTCVPQRYERVAGRTEYPIEELKSAGVLL